MSFWTQKKIQQVKVSATRPDDLNLTQTHIRERELTPS